MLSTQPAESYIDPFSSTNNENNSESTHRFRRRANKFIDINTPNVDNVLLPFRTEADRGFQEEFALAGLAFNHPVTLELFKKLQTAQFAIGNVCNPGNAGYTALTVSATDRPDTTNAESEACLPSLSRNQINSILTGQIGDWDSLLDSSGASLAGLTGNTQICRRVNGSGTQATINAWTSSYACDPNRTDNSVDIIQPLTAATAGVFENSGSGDVDNCLHNINAGTQGTNKFAIGNLSVEGRNVDKARGWRFIKIDGYAPTLANIHDGKYSFWAQQACQRRKESLPYNVAVGVDDTIANKKKVFDSLCSTASTRGLNSISSLTKLNNERNVANCNAGTLADCGSNYTWGRSGWLATPTSNLVYDNVLAPTTNPVNVYTREVSTGKVNICQTPVKSIEGDNLFNGIIVTN